MGLIMRRSPFFDGLHFAGGGGIFGGGVFAVLLLLPDGIAAVDLGNDRKVIKSRRRSGCPLEGAPIPRIPCRIFVLLPFFIGDPNLHHLAPHAAGDEPSANRRNDKERVPSCRRIVVV